METIFNTRVCRNCGIYITPVVTPNMGWAWADFHGGVGCLPYRAHRPSRLFHRVRHTLPADGTLPAYIPVKADAHPLVSSIGYGGS